MDGSRPDRPVSQASRQNQLQRAAPKNKLPKVHSAPVELTPLSRLARFKEIRDRNLARASTAQNLRGSNLVNRNSSKMLNLNNGTSNTNGMAVATHSNPEHHEGPSSPAKAKSVKKVSNGVESAEPSPKNSEPTPKKPEPTTQKPSSAPNGVGAGEGGTPQNGVEAPSQVNPPEEEGNDVLALEEELAENEATEASEAETEGENGQDSEGSSLDVVVDESSTGESLDLNITSTGMADVFLTPQKSSLKGAVIVQGPSGSDQQEALEPASNVDEPYVPDVIKRLNSGGHISSRPTLRGKRRHEDDSYPESGRKRYRDDSSTVATSASLSTSWQFFSPTSALKRVWNRQAEPAGPKPEDDSMIVNLSTGDPQKSQKWCRIM